MQVNDVNFENMSNDDAVRILREIVSKPGWAASPNLFTVHSEYACPGTFTDFYWMLLSQTYKSHSG